MKFFLILFRTSGFNIYIFLEMQANKETDHSMNGGPIADDVIRAQNLLR